MQHMARLTPREDRRRRALDAIMRNLDITDKALGERLGIARSAVQQWHCKPPRTTKLREDQLDALAEALDVPAWLFDEDPPEVLRWLADNRTQQVYAASGWLRQTA